MTRSGHIRRLNCRACLAPCQPYLAGEIDHNDPDMACPIGTWHRLTPAPMAPARPVLSPFNGAAKWQAIEDLAINDQITASWLELWAMDLPVFGCQCRPHWQAWIKDNPLPQINQFEWIVTAHNVVNVRLGRPEWTVDEALQRRQNTR